MQKALRLKRELKQLQEKPPGGISCWPKEDRTDHLEARILGQENTPYFGGNFKVEIVIQERYPFEPPQVRFVTPIYHPNIDNAGRICLDILKMPPKGNWKPSLNIFTVLTSIQVLMADPNPNDPLMADISTEFKCNKAQFIENAKKWTEKYAMDDKIKALPEDRNEEKILLPVSENSSNLQSDSSNTGNSRKRLSDESLGETSSFGTSSKHLKLGL